MTDTVGVRITGTGSFVPPRAASNEILCRYLGKSPEWVEKYLGIKSRRFSYDLETRKTDECLHDGDLAYEAAKQALDMAKIGADSLDLIVRITCTPEYLHFPDPGCMLHRRLGGPRDCAAFSLDAGCGGLVYALNIACGLIRANDLRRVLIVPSNTSSPFHARWRADDPQRQLLEGFIFGDGASALVLERTDDPDRGILHTYWGAWPEDDPMRYPAGGSRHPTTPDNWQDHEYRLNAKAVKTHSPAHVRYSLAKILEKSGRALSEIDWFLFHQVNGRILEQLSRESAIAREKMLINADRYGNTSAASIGILLDEAVREGKIKDRDLLLMVAVGAGWQYGAALIRW